MTWRKRRWLQYNLRTLLALTTLAAGGSAYVGAQVRDYYLEQEAIAQLGAVTTVLIPAGQRRLPNLC